MNSNTFARPIAVCLLLQLLICLSAAQTPTTIVRISAGVAAENLIKKVEPVWPSQMEKLHIKGYVVLRVSISTEGKVESTQVARGHPLALQAALDAVKQWEYKPFLLNGQTVRVETTVEIPFSSWTPEEQASFDAAAKRFHDEEQRCGNLVTARAFAAAETSCATLPELSQKLEPFLAVERARAYRDVGIAFFAESKFQDALTAFQRELEIAKAQLLSASVDKARAYADVARGLQSTSHHQEASTNYSEAIAILERARELQDSMQASEVTRQQTVKELQQVLRDYAQLLRQLGKRAEADVVDGKIQSLSAETNLKNQ